MTEYDSMGFAMPPGCALAECLDAAGIDGSVEWRPDAARAEALSSPPDRHTD